MLGFRSKKNPGGISTVRESAVGLVRRNNEDHLLLDDSRLVYCVADGMGGGECGEKASEIVCAEVAMMVGMQPDEFAVRMEAACNAVVCSNQAIYDYAKSMGFEQMGTTLVMMIFDPADASRAVVCHVGDSRAYRFRKGEVTALTRDHSVGVELGRQLGCGEELSDRANPLAHVLTRAIGVADTVCPDWKKLKVESGDRYLLCSDGVHDVVSDARLGELVTGGTLETAKRRLSAEILECGAPDNFSFILLEVGGVSRR